MPQNEEETRPASPPRSGLNGAILYLYNNKITTLLMLTRIATIVYTILHSLPSTGSYYQNYYQKALLANAATSALRLHQRLPVFCLNQEFLNSVFMEDSCHYLFYSLIFLFTSPITLVLLPVSLFAFLNLLRLALILTESDPRGRYAESLASFISYYAPSIFQSVALAEIFIMPITILAIFVRMGSLMTPFFYYRFITLRYKSRRNRYSRQTFKGNVQ